MQVPERLALIGGGILLSTSLIWGLKDTVSHVLPTVGSSTSKIDQSTTHLSVLQNDHFQKGYQDAIAHGQTTGYWGTAKYYMDGQHNMYVGSGELIGHLSDVLRLSPTPSSEVSSITFQAPAKLPADSSWMFASGPQGLNTSLTHINGLDNLDTSGVTDMQGMFTRNASLHSLGGIEDWDTTHVTSMSSMFDWTGIRSLDLSHWNVANVSNMVNMFYGATNLRSLNVRGWQTKDVTSMEGIFNSDTSLHGLDLSGWQTTHVTQMSKMFYHDSGLMNLDLSSLDTTNAERTDALNGTSSLQHLRLGPRTYLDDTSLPSTMWQDGSQRLDTNGLSHDIHPGDWYLS